MKRDARSRGCVGAATGAVVLALSIVGCAGAPDDQVTRQSGLLGGWSLPNGRPEVVHWDGPGCTATMIASNVFVSAAHCINHAWEVTGAAAGTLTNDALGQDPIAIERVFSQGLADAESGSNTPDDIAVGRLVYPMSGIVPATIGTSEPGPGYLTTIGYGCTTTRTKPCSGSRTYLEYDYDGSDPSNVSAPGDSGGPTFIGLLEDNGPIVRLNSGDVDIPFITAYDVGSDAVKYRAQILGMSTALNAAGLSYRSQVQSQGWMAAVSQGALSGTTGQSLRLEAVQVWSETAGVVPKYRAYVQNQGWQPEVSDGAMAGTVGQSLRMEAFQIRLDQPGPYTHVMYRAYVQNHGWQPYIVDGQVCSVDSNCPSNLCAGGTCAVGTTGQSLRIEALEIAAL